MLLGRVGGCRGGPGPTAPGTRAGDAVRSLRLRTAFLRGPPTAPATPPASVPCRGLRGFSPLVRDAIDSYLATLTPDETEAALALEGSLTEEEAAEVERRIKDAWATWPSAS